MTDPSGFGSGSHPIFHGPLSLERADRLVAELAGRRPTTVVDYGCDWRELLLRVLEAAPGARGVGVDLFGPHLARGRDSAQKRGLADRVVFIEGSATDHTSMADVVICCGAYQAFGTIHEALDALRALVNPGGLMLFGAEIWDQTPTEQQLANMWPGITVEACLHLPDLVDAAVAAGFRPFGSGRRRDQSGRSSSPATQPGTRSGCWPTRTIPRPSRREIALTGIGRSGCEGIAT
jgi:SAM-dependent methyltransferase